jgi:REP element-mobilizing transposase RayT
MTYSRLLRGRVSIPHQYYALTFCTLDRQRILGPDRCAENVAAALHRSSELAYCENFAFVVMPDHVHWLLALTGKLSLARLMSATKSEASRRLQAECGLRLPIWQSGFYDHQIRADEDMLEQARYLVANPLRAGLVKRLADYPHWFAVWASPPHGPAAGEVTGEELLGP